MASTIKIGSRNIGHGEPIYIVGEIGINHNGDLNIAKRLIDVAAETGLNAVKFQKRTPELCVPRDQWDIERDTPWGVMKYIDYRHKVEFNQNEYEEIAKYCNSRNIDWFASPWDEEAVDFLERFDVVCYKIASASVTDISLLNKIRSTGRPKIMSSGMSTMAEIRSGLETLGHDNLLVCHSTSSYPCDVSELNLNMIKTLKNEFNIPVGYSGHERGIAICTSSVALGACAIERHFTKDRSMKGPDHASSVEPIGFQNIVSRSKKIFLAMGDPNKTVLNCELSNRKKFRGY